MQPEPFVLRLDIEAFARAGACSAGQKTLVAFPRLLAETGDAGAQQVLTWQARGERRQEQAGRSQLWLHLQVDVALPLVCQRCLEVVLAPLRLARAFRFVASEEEAWAQDENAQEDVLVQSREFDLVALIEDEVLMDLPLVARHDVCQAEVKWSARDSDFSDSDDSARRPFAALSKWRTKGSG
jgi:uncharacterized protein